MRKQIAIFSLLFMISITSGAEIEELDNYNAKNKIIEFQTTDNSDFQLLINSRANSLLFDKQSELREIAARSQFPPTTRLSENENLWLTGTQYTSPKWYVLNSSGQTVAEGSVNVAVNRGAFVSNNKIYSSNSYDTSIYRRDGSLVSEVPVKGSFYTVVEKGEFDSDNDQELLLDHVGGDYFTLIDEFGDIEWRLSGNPPRNGKLVEDKLLTWKRDRISLRHSNNGTAIWSRERDQASNPVVVDNKILYFSENRFVKINKQTGEKIVEGGNYSRVRALQKFPSKDRLVGYQNQNISFFDLDGEKLGTKKFEGLQQRPQLTEYDRTDGKELAIATQKQVKILDIGFEEKPENLNQSLKDTVFVGKGKEMLKAVALNQTSFITENYDKVREEVEKPGSKPVSVNVDGPRQVQDVNSAFNISRPKYYADNREKAAYVAALAAKNNASLTFDEGQADRDFSNYSVKELQEVFIEEFRPNHVTVADLDSEKGVLASYMAVKQGSLPVDFSQEYDYSRDVAVYEQNRYNGVIQLESRIKKKFNQIGENQNTLFDGKYISLLSGPRKTYKDPVESGLISDPADGSRYYSDLSYGNLDDDRMLEAGVGRYPEKPSQASLIFHRSMERNIGREALVSSEYLHSNWPVILSTFGGGMRHGSTVENTLKEEGFETTHLVERRSDPVNFLMSLTPVEMSGFLEETDSIENRLKKVVSDNAAHSVKNAIIVVKALNYAEKIVEMYYEFRWETYEFDLERGMNRVDDLEIPEDGSPKAVIEKGVMKAIYVLVWPDPHPKLTEERMASNMSDTDIIYYSGVGNSTSWTLPNNDSSLLKDRYSGKNHIDPNKIPAIDKSVVWDNSNQAGRRNAPMKNQFIEKGASSFLGFSTVNYAAYSGMMGNNFFRYGKTLGNSELEAVNSIRTSGMIYSPTSVHLTGVRQKMANSLSLYGNPEMPKDPITPEGWNITRECANFECNVQMERSPGYSMEKENGKKLIKFNTTDYLLVPGAPITPLYSIDYGLPPNSSIQNTVLETEYKKLENVYTPKTELLSYGGEYTNTSERFETFPENLSNTSITENELRHVQAGIQETGNDTRVLQKVQLEFSYTSPLVLDVRKQSDQAVASVSSKKNLDAKIIYSLDGNKSSKKVDIEKGENRFELGELEKGITDIEVYLVDREIVEQVKTELRLKKEPEIQVFAPNIHRGDIREITAVVENTNSFPVTEELEVRLGEKLQLGMLENPMRKIDLKPNETRQVSWSFTGIDEGNSSVKLGNSSDNLKVRSGRSTDLFLGTGEFYRNLDSPYRSFSQTQTQSKLVLKLQTEAGELKYRKTPDYEFSLIETEKFKAVKNTSSSGEKQKVSTSQGSYVSETYNGVTKTRTENLNETKAKNLLEKLEKEIIKLKEAYKSSQSIK